MTSPNQSKEVFKIVYKGLPPKDEDARVNRIPKKYDKTIINQDEEVTVRGIDLPELAPTGRPWCERTKDWWYTWRISPQAKLMGPTDWEFMLEIAVLHNEYWTPPKIVDGEYKGSLSPTARANYAAEMRQRVAKFGATWEDRQKLQLTIETPQSEEELDKRIAQEAKSITNYAERLNKKAAEQKES
jgi:hypothetical protein